MQPREARPIPFAGCADADRQAGPADEARDDLAPVRDVQVDVIGAAVALGPAEREVVDARVRQPVRVLSGRRPDEHQRVQVAPRGSVRRPTRRAQELVSPNVLPRGERGVDRRDLGRVELGRRARGSRLAARLAADSDDRAGERRYENGKPYSLSSDRHA